MLCPLFSPSSVNLWRSSWILMESCEVKARPCGPCWEAFLTRYLLPTYLSPSLPLQFLFRIAVTGDIQTFPRLGLAIHLTISGVIPHGVITFIALKILLFCASWLTCRLPLSQTWVWGCINCLLLLVAMAVNGQDVQRSLMAFLNVNCSLQN